MSIRDRLLFRRRPEPQDPVSAGLRRADESLDSFIGAMHSLSHLTNNPAFCDLAYKARKLRNITQLAEKTPDKWVEIVTRDQEKNERIL